LIGNMVYSRYGHDKGKLFAVIQEDELHFYLADGKSRLIKKPKKKKRKHVQITNYKSDVLLDKILNGTCLDLDIKMAVKKYKKIVNIGSEEIVEERRN